jgi:hypothetical protein
MASPIRIEGRLAERASAQMYGCGHYVVRLVLAQRTGEPILIEWPFGTGPAADIASHSAAQQLRKDQPLTVEGNHLQITRHRGAPALKLCGAVTVIRPVAQPFHEAATAVA